MKFKIIGQGDDGLVRSPQRHWLIIEYPVADVLNTCRREMVERVEGLRQARTEPAARSLAREFRDNRYGLVDHCLLVIELVHWDLIIAVRVQLPTGVNAGSDDDRVGFADTGI